MIYAYNSIKNREYHWYQKLSFFNVICRREYYAYRDPPSVHPPPLFCVCLVVGFLVVRPHKINLFLGVGGLALDLG